MKITGDNFKIILNKIRQIGIINTIRFNFGYFSFREAVKFPIIAGRNLKIKKLKGEVKILNPKTACVKIGFDHMGGIFDYKRELAIWEVRNGCRVVFEGEAKIGNGCRICVVDGGSLFIGDAFEVAAKTTLLCSHDIRIGRECLFSWEIMIIDSDLHFIYDNNGALLNETDRLVIRDRVWIGCRATILKNSYIPSGVIIGAGSLVNSKLETPNSVYGGIPCRLLKNDVYWKR